VVNEDASKLWTPDARTLGASVSEIVQAYSVFLEVHFPDQHRTFRLRTVSDPNAANAEAVIFSWLRWHSLSPTPADAPGSGGPDFLCSPRRSCSRSQALILTLFRSARAGPMS
jgi:hypothetical protein